MMALDVLYIILLAFVAGRISCVIVPVKLDAVIHWFTDVEEEEEDDDDVWDGCLLYERRCFCPHLDQ